MEKLQSQPLAIEKIMTGKLIKVGGNRIGFTCNGEWQWTPWAKQRYSDEERNLAKSFAESD